MTNAQQEIQSVIDDLSAKIVDLETRTGALKDLRYYARNVLSKYEPNQFFGMTAQEAIEFEDKELPSSGIYGSLYAKPSAENQAVNYADESGYTEQDQQAAALVHDAELDHLSDIIKFCKNANCKPKSVTTFDRYAVVIPLAESAQYLGVTTDMLTAARMNDEIMGYIPDQQSEVHYSLEDLAKLKAKMRDDAELDPALVELCSNTTIYEK